MKIHECYLQAWARFEEISIPIYRCRACGAELSGTDKLWEHIIKFQFTVPEKVKLNDNWSA